MIIHYDKDIYINITKPAPKTQKLSQEAAVTDYLNKSFYFREVADHTSCAKAVCVFLARENIETAIDFMAGIGLVSGLIARYLEPSLLISNDLDEYCSSIRSANIGLNPHVRVTTEDAFKMKVKPQDLIWLDFNTFTLKGGEMWLDWLSDLKTRILVIADTACYGFYKFGGKNLEVYGVKTPMEYYRKVGDHLQRPVWAISHHRNAAWIVMGPKLSKTLRKPVELPLIDVRMSRYHSGGFLSGVGAKHA